VSADARPQPRLRDGLRDTIVVFLTVRLAVLVLSPMVGGMLPLPPNQPPTDAGFPAPPLQPGWHMLIDATERQDALWFQRLATDGYRANDSSAAFFPLYPMAIRAVAWLPGIGPLGAALLVSNAAFFLALLVLRAFAHREIGEAAARRSLWFVALFPTSFFFLAPYSESLFLLLSVLAFWSARRERWVAAAVAAAVAGLTRSVGAVLILGLAIEAVRQWREGGRPLPRLAGGPAPALGPLAYFLWWQVRFGAFWAPLTTQAAWRPGGPASPIETVRAAWRYAWRYQTWWLLDLLVVALVVAGLVLALRRVPAALTAYAAASLVLPLMFPLSDRPLMSMPRFAAVLFPAAWGFAALGDRHPRLADGVLAASAAAFGMLFLLFVNWWYVF
jgi:hypothetical protein